MIPSQPGCVADFREGAQDDQFIDDAAAGPDHGFSVAAHVPSKAKAGADIIVIAIVYARDLDSFLDDSQVRIEAAENVVPIMRNGSEFVAHTEIQRKSRMDAPVILEENRVRHPPYMRFGVAVEQRRRFQPARRGTYGDRTDALPTGKYPGWRAISQRTSGCIVGYSILTRQECQQSITGPFGIGVLPKAESTLSISPRPAILMAGHDRTAKPQRVLTPQVVDLIADLDGGVRPLNLGVARSNCAEAVE